MTITDVSIELSDTDTTPEAVLATRVPEDVQVWLRDDEIDYSIRTNDSANQHRQMAIRRIRDNAGSVLRHQFALGDVYAVDIWFGVPLACGLASGEINPASVIAVPLEARRRYSLVIPLDGGRTQVLLRLWNVLGIAAAMSGLVVGISAGVGAIYRTIRRRRGKCQACGYALGGIAGDAPCPECGSTR